MFCRNCGNEIEEDDLFCLHCGFKLNEVHLNNSSHNNLIGFSSKINDPAFEKYLKSTKQWSYIFSVIIAIIAIIGFAIYGFVSTEMDNPQALFIGLGIGGMFILIAVFQNISRARTKTWDGKVVDKKIEKKRRKSYSGEDYTWIDYMLFTVFIRSYDGKMHTISAEDEDTVYNYYQIGDFVRHHKGLNSYEKYDKSRDTIIFCNACATLNDINDDFCIRCNCPLLK